MTVAAREVNVPQSETPMGEMNTTPLIDVMLVLLIMFIITIPIQTHAVKIDLPSGPNVVSQPDPVRNKVMVDADGVIHWNGAAIDQASLRVYLDKSMQLPVEPDLQFEADPAARFVVVDGVLADIKRAGVTKMGMVGNERFGEF